MKRAATLWVLFFLWMGVASARGEETLRPVVQTGHPSAVVWVAFNQDSSLLASVDTEHTIKIWHWPAKHLIRTWGSKSEILWGLGFGPTGNFITAGTSGLEIWDPLTGVLLKTIRLDPVKDPDWVTVGTSHAAIAKKEEHGYRVHLIDLTTGETARSFEVGARTIYSLALSDHGSHLAVWFQTEQKQATLTIWRVADGKKIRTASVVDAAEASGAPYMAFSPDGSLLAMNEVKSTVIRKTSDWSIAATFDGAVLRPSGKPFSPDGAYFVAGGGSAGLTIRRTTDWSGHGQAQMECPRSFSWSPDSRHLALGGGCFEGSGKFYQGYPLAAYELDSQQMAKFYEEGLWIHSMAFSPDGKVLACSTEGENPEGKNTEKDSSDKLRVYRLSDARLLWEQELEERQSEIVFNPSGEFLLSRGYAAINRWRATDGDLIETVRYKEHQHNAGFALSRDGQLMATPGETNFAGAKRGIANPINLWRVSDQALVGHLRGHNQFIWSMAFRPDNTGLVSGDGGGNLIFWEILKHGQLQVEKRSDPDDPAMVYTVAKSEGGLLKIAKRSELGTGGIRRLEFSADGRLLGVAVEGKKDAEGESEIILRRVSDDKVVKRFPRTRDFAFSPDGRGIVTRTNTGLTITPLTGDQPGVVLQGTTDFLYPDKTLFSPDGRLIAASANNNSIKLWDAATGNLLATLFPFGRASVILTPEGFFSGTGDFNQHVHFVRGQATFDFNQFYDVFYRPDLVQKKLNGEDISKYTHGLNIEEALRNPPPQVEIVTSTGGRKLSERKATVKLRVQDSGGGIGDIRLYHNGKLIHSSGVYRIARSPSDEIPRESSPGEAHATYRMAQRGVVTVMAQRDPLRSAVQLSPIAPATGTVQKQYEVTLIQGNNTISAAAFNGSNTVMSNLFTTRIEGTATDNKPRLFALVVGNDRFADQTRNLRFAVKDATDFTKMLEKTARPVFTDVQTRTLTNATKAAMVEAVNDLTGRMNPEDLFIFYVASHGRADDDLYYIYTSDFDGNATAERSRISSLELMEYSKTIPALHSIFFLDTCQAGGLESIVTALYDSRISVLARALGMHIFAGAGTTQSALEGFEGNGLFTHFLLSGIDGQADGDGDGSVRVMELTPFLMIHVRQASKGSQEPFIRNFGDDFFLSRPR
jgi:WD40 repeat protein